MAEPGVGGRSCPGPGPGRCRGHRPPAGGHLVRGLRVEHDHGCGCHARASVAGVGPGRAPGGRGARGAVRAAGRAPGEGTRGPGQGLSVEDGARRVRRPGRGGGGPARLHPPPQGHRGGLEPGRGVDVPGRAARLRTSAAPGPAPDGAEGRGALGLRGLHRPPVGLGGLVEHLPPPGAVEGPLPAPGVGGGSDASA